MVERYRRNKNKQKLLGNHQKCWLWGRHLILELMRSGRWLPLEVTVSTGLPPDSLNEIDRLAVQHAVPLRIESPDKLKQQCRSSEHQGYVAKMPEYTYESNWQTIVHNALSPLVVICDRLQDPYNFGAILRSADAFSATAVLIGEAEQVGVTNLVARASAGAISHVPIGRVGDLVEAVTYLKSRDIRVTACSEKTDQQLAECNLKSCTAVIIGNEGSGVSRELLDASDDIAAIPMAGNVSSLNAAVAAGIALYEVSRQRSG